MRGGRGERPTPLSITSDRLRGREVMGWEEGEEGTGGEKMEKIGR